MNLSDLPCPYCFGSKGENCVEDCPQYPISLDEGKVYADPDTLLEIPSSVLRRIRRGRQMPDDVGLPSSACKGRAYVNYIR